ncbi:MAG: GNAT family N-acetyltransferase [Planctomycetaceae bacterium]|nr:GNAT family N-acetyltransferase [Planctomycetaceae bacterium]
MKQPESLTSLELQRWRDIVRSSEQFQSPYFQPDFTLAVAACRDDVRVAVISEGDHITGFFPFQQSGSEARPVGGQLSDAHGVIHTADLELSYPQLMKQCGLTAWHYHYQIAPQIPRRTAGCDIAPAAVMNLTGGFDRYASRLESKNVIRQVDRKARKLAREHGEIQFAWNCLSGDVMQQLLDWKSAQYVDSDIADVFSFGWTRELLHTIWRRTDSPLQGLLSVLTVGDRPVAIHFGLRAGRVLHQWFPAYDPELRDYSPGMIHLLEMARHCESQGVEQIDLGRICHYKARVATHTVDVAAGCLDLRPVRRLLRVSYQQTFDWLRRSPLRTVARAPGRMLRRITEQRQFQ